MRCRAWILEALIGQENLRSVTLNGEVVYEADSV